MARDTADLTEITSRNQLVDALARGCKPPTQFRIGTEHEKIPFNIEDFTSVPYDGDRGIRAILEGMRNELGWQPVMDEDRLIGLFDTEIGGAISLEPGGQFELSGAPLLDLHQTCAETHTHLKLVRKVAQPLGVDFLGLGFAPHWSRSDIKIMPKSRYDIMRNYMPKRGRYGLDMMLRTATIQVNLDFSSEQDMVRKMRLGLALQPLATALFANSPFKDGQLSGFQSLRSEFWRDTDPDRTGTLPFVFEDGFGFERYVDWVLKVPMYFVTRNNAYTDMTHYTFQDFLDGKAHAQHPNLGPPNLGDWDNHLTTMFPEVRLKRFIEQRGGDGGPWDRICALPAFWVGLYYHEETLQQALDFVDDWSPQERQYLRDTAPKSGLHTPFRNGTLLDIAREVVPMALSGLRARNIQNSAGSHEGVFLETVEEIVASGKNAAQRLIAQYQNEWRGDIMRAFSQRVLQA